MYNSKSTEMVTFRDSRPAADAKELMGYVLNPTRENLVKAKALYAADPRLLFIKTNGYEPASGFEEYVDEAGAGRIRCVRREIIASSFQAALGTGDVELYNDMATYFSELESGNVTALKQMQEQFPNGVEYPPIDAEFRELIDNISSAIELDQTLITRDNPSVTTQKAVRELRKYLLPKPVNQGHHFNLNYLIKAFNIYNQNCKLWNENQLSLFWCQVIGYLERLISVVDAQAFCEGLFYVLKQNQPQARSLSIFNYQSRTEMSYFHENSTSIRLGFDFGIGFCSGGAVARPRHTLSMDMLVPPLKNYAEQKQQNLAAFSEVLTQQAERNSARCAIL